MTSFISKGLGQLVGHIDNQTLSVPNTTEGRAILKDWFLDFGIEIYLDQKCEDGHGAGYGDVSGHGLGNGYGDGDVSGHGLGNGYGDGYGYGNGYGYVDGNGYGDGDGRGDGYGYGFGY